MTNRLLVNALVILGVTVLVFSILGGLITSSVARVVFGIFVIVAVLATAAVSIILIVRLREMSRFGLLTLIVAVVWIPVTILLQVVVNLGLALDSGLGQVVATICWALWIIWLISSLALFITWIVVKVGATGRKRSEAGHGYLFVPVSPPGWYSDPAGSGRMRWWDGVVWSDNYGDAPSKPS